MVFKLVRSHHIVNGWTVTLHLTKCYVYRVKILLRFLAALLSSYKFM